jgi:hypothetical protein
MPLLTVDESTRAFDIRLEASAHEYRRHGGQRLTKMDDWYMIQNDVRQHLQNFNRNFLLR